ncbi:protein FAR1-RELATED SEQUENCE 5-like [Aristolochia californica]|uniref:protein FAR1-RELATED SEQUENCE 5-like n=1 Tax=Aristolochia californica TaxID=171875 RepID=UPI0035D5C3AD
MSSSIGLDVADTPDEVAMMDAESTQYHSQRDVDVETCLCRDNHMIEVSTPFRRDLYTEMDGVSFEGQEFMEPFEGMDFDSIDAAREYYNAYARVTGFSIRVDKNRRSLSTKEVVMQSFVCYKEGHRRKKKVDKETQRAIPITREGCKAMLMVNKRDGLWRVTKFVRDHNHELLSLGKVHFLRSHRKSSAPPKIIYDHCKDAGVSTNLVISLLNEQSQGNCLKGRREIALQSGDAQAVMNQFKHLKNENPSFFYSIQFDETNQAINFFWVDARSRVAYQFFGDVVRSDTMTYKLNNYNVPFVPFIGVNHHNQPILFGGGLLFDETEESFIWLFHLWLEAMSGRPPMSMVTDYDPVIGTAIAEVFPNTCLRYCVWHIMKKFHDQVSHISVADKELNNKLQHCIFSESIDEFEERWEELIDMCNLRENQWCQLMYDIRDQWVPVYVRNSFFAELSCVQNRESINSYFYGYINSKTTVAELIKQYMRAVDNQFEKEVHADFESIHIKPVLRTPMPMEEQAANAYTKAIFMKFQDELMSCLSYNTEELERDGTVIKYRVTEFGTEKRPYIVGLNLSENKCKCCCSCQMFEFSGILCRHVLIVLRVKSIMVIPPQYILERWTRYAKGGVVLDECSIKTKGDYNPTLGMRFNDLCQRVIRFAENGSKSEEVYRIALHALQKANDEVVTAFNKLTVVDEIQGEKSEANSLKKKSVIVFESPNVLKKVESPSGLDPYLEEGEKVSLGSVNKGINGNNCS